MKESDKKKIGEAYLRLHSCNEEEGMTDEEAIKIIKQFRDRQGNSSDDNEALDIAIKALEQTSWIPVSERLPEEETDVLVCNENGDIEITSGSYSTEFENHFMWYTSGWRFGEVIAWMPLPTPYKGVEE